MHICEWCREELADDDQVVDVATITHVTEFRKTVDVEGIHELYHVRCWYADSSIRREKRRGRWGDIRAGMQ
jgi:hypothetical protein